MAFDELSPMAWLGIGFIVLAIGGLIMLFVVNLQDELNAQFQASSAITQEVKDFSDQKTTETREVLDYMFLGLFMTLALACVLVARATSIEPFWTVLLFIILVLIVIGGAFISNLAYEVDAAGDLGFSDKLPITHHIIDNAVAYIISIGLATLLFSRGGPGRDF